MLFAFTAVFALLGGVLGVAQGVPILYDFGEAAGDVLAERNDDGSTGFSLNVGFPVFGVVRLSGYVSLYENTDLLDLFAIERCVHSVPTHTGVVSLCGWVDRHVLYRARFHHVINHYLATKMVVSLLD